MADVPGTKISALDAVVDLLDDDEVPLRRGSGDKKITVANLKAAVGGGLAEWDAETTYQTGEIALDRGGLWASEVDDNLNSRPISGNSDWRLVGGTPYVRTTVTRQEVLGLFNFPLATVPSPGSGKLLRIVGGTYWQKFGTVAYTAGSVPALWVGDASEFAAGNFTGPTALHSFGSDDFMKESEDVAAPLAFGSFYDDADKVYGLAATMENKPIYLGADSPQQGPIATVVIRDGGTGYVVGDTGTIGSGGGTYEVATVSGGVVTSITLTDPGTAHIIANGETTEAGGGQPGSGTGLTLDVTDLTADAGDGEAVVDVYYGIVTRP